MRSDTTPSGNPASMVAPVITEPSAPARKSAGHQMLWYVPNRLLDMADMFRLRLRVGPGLAVNLRMTDFANFYAGRYHTAFIGLPGPRMQPQPRLPVGLEQERGIILMDVDATDDLPYSPHYSPSEFVCGGQFLILGIEAGFDPVEIGDFLSGLILLDPRGDDH